MQHRLYFAILIYFLLSVKTGEAQKDLYSDSITTYIFMSDECLICQDYSNTINNLVQDYASDEMKFIGVFPNFSSKKDKIKAFKEKYNFTFEMKTDYFKKRTEKFDVEVTPEVVVFDEKKEKILYQGRIDNAFYSIGKRRRVITTSELGDALLAIANQTVILKPKTQPIGCFINKLDNLSN